MKSAILSLALLLTICSLSLAQHPTNSGAKKELAELQLVKREQAKAKLAWKSTPTKKGVRVHYIRATNALANMYMTASALEPKVKYKEALHYFREVLKVDPTDRVAKQSADMIISIYKSMHRPIPKD